MDSNLLKTIEGAELELVCGGAFVTAFTRVSALGTYISILSWAEKVGEGLGNGLYDGLHE